MIDKSILVQPVIKFFDEESELEQHGVKGMKWGVRRSEAQLAAARRGSAKTEVSSLSDSELRTKINRIQMERQYVDLVAPKHVSAGKKMVKEVLANSVKSTAQTYTTKYMTKGVDYLIKKAASK